MGGIAWGRSVLEMRRGEFAPTGLSRVASLLRIGRRYWVWCVWGVNREGEWQSRAHIDAPSGQFQHSHRSEQPTQSRGLFFCLGGGGSWLPHRRNPAAQRPPYAHFAQRTAAHSERPATALGARREPRFAHRATRGTATASWAAMRFVLVLAVMMSRTCHALKFDMQGQCAALFHSQKWLDEDDLHNWDYKVRVEPWTVFGQVTVKLHGINMQLENVYGGTVSKLGGSTFTVQLNAVGGAGCDDCFEISGTGQPSANPELSCSGLLSAEERSSCPLGVTFHIVSLMRPGEDGGGEDGAFNAAAHVTTWVEPTDVTLSFDKPVTIRDVWNSFIVDGGVESKNTVFRLKKQVCFAPREGHACTRLVAMIARARTLSTHRCAPPFGRLDRWARGMASARILSASRLTAKLDGFHM